MAMRTRNSRMNLRALAVAVPAALAALYGPAAQAQDDAAKAPLSTVEVGVIGVSKDSAKFGEYNGLTTRSAGADYAQQGRWNLGMRFDQLTHYTSDSYQTPYSGAMGGNSFTL